MNNVYIDVTVLEPGKKHPAIFDAFDNLATGHSVFIRNDHDPKPLYYQLLGKRGNCFSWTYLANGPDIWEVEIKKNEKNEETVGEIARKDMRKAELFKKLGIDFCCGGKKTLAEACREKGLDVLRVQQELEHASHTEATALPLNFDSWTLSFLADYIVNVHHKYVKESSPLLAELSEKAAVRHGAHNPSLVAVRENTEALLHELANHMQKEELILFPYIKKLEAEGPANVPAPGFQTVRNPIFMMEAEHDTAAMLAKAIRAATNDYAIPADACNSVALLFRKLEEFEKDLFQHIHLENNILFPKAIALEWK